MQLVSIAPRGPWRLRSDPVRSSDVEQALCLTYRPRRPVGEGWYRLNVEFPAAGVIDHVVELRLADGRRALHRLEVSARNRFDGGLRVDGALDRLLLHVSGSGEVRRPPLLVLSPWPPGPPALRDRARWLWRLGRAAPLGLPRRMARALRRLASPGRGGQAPDPGRAWRERFDERPEHDRPLHLARLGRLRRRPLISVLASLDGGREELERLAEGMARQIYPHWELLVAAGPGEALPPEVALPPGGAVRLCRSPGPGRARALDAALAEASGALVVAHPPGGEWRAHALLECALAADLLPGAKLLYADHGVLRPGGEAVPCPKPAWSPERLDGEDYIADPVWFEAGRLRALGGWGSGPEGGQDHDLKRRFAEGLAADEIVHIPKVLLHRPVPGADPAGREGGPEAAGAVPLPWIRPGPPPAAPVTVIIPTRDRADLLRTCIASLVRRTRYPDYEILVVDNASAEPAALRLLAELADDPRISVLRHPGPFNYSALNNAAVGQARGEVLALLNNDVEAVSLHWLAEMVRLALRPGIGCVGPKLLYPDGSVQHAGIALGLYDGAGHLHRHAGARAHDDLLAVRNVSAVTGACLVVRKALYEAVGGLDEAVLPVAFNDVDLCLKAAAAGCRNVWTPFAELIHHESASRGRDDAPEKAARARVEASAMHTRWGLRLLVDPYYSPHLTYQAEDGGLRTR